MNENIDLTKILKDCPKGTKLYSSTFGQVEFQYIKSDSMYPIVIKLENGVIESIASDGKIFNDYNGECILFPSKDQRDWSKFTAPWYKKEKFDPKTLKTFDRVLIKSDDDITWVANLFSHAIKFHDKVTGNDYLESVTAYCTSSYCIPYNEETKHLVGTTEEAPEYYRYWED